MNEANKKDTSTENDKGGCFTTFFAILIILALIIGIPSCMSYQQERKREAEEAYERSLPKAPTFISREQTTEKLQKNVGEKIKISTGDFLTTTYTIHSIECTDVRQIGIRRDNVTVDIKAYTYYIDGKLTFTKTDRYTYNFDTNKWDSHAGEWLPENIEINN